MPVRLELREGIVRIDWQGTTSDEEMQAHLEELSRTLAPLSTYAMIHDARRSSPPGAKNRQRMADWMRANEHRIARSCVGVAFVIDSAIVRGALTAILWVQPMAAPHLVTAFPEEATRFCVERLASRGREVRSARV